MKKINCAVIGMGVGERHASFYQKFKKTNLCKIYETNKDKVRKLKKKFPEAEFVKSEQEIYKDKTIQLVSIASYDNFHCNQIIQCIKNNKYIFVEKPLCLNINELRKIKKYYEKFNSKISCNLILRGSPQFKKIYNLNLQKKLGKIFYLEGDYNYGRLRKITKGWRGKIPFYSVTCGGGVHMVDLMTWILNELPVQIKAEANRIVTKNTKFKFNDFSVAILKFKSGKIAKISSNFGCKIPHHHTLKIFGTKGTIFHEINGSNFYTSRSKKISPNFFNLKFENKNKNNILKSFVLNLIGKGKNLITFQEVVNSMLICLGIEKSFKTNKNIKIDFRKLKIS